MTQTAAVDQYLLCMLLLCFFILLISFRQFLFLSGYLRLLCHPLLASLSSYFPQRFLAFGEYGWIIQGFRVK
jgi:hypothetical protein